MAEILGGRWGRYLQSLFNLNQALTLGEVLPDVLPTVNVEQPRPELELFLGNALYWGYHSVAAVAAQNGQVLLSMPATSDGSGNMVAVVEKIRILNTTAGAVTYTLNFSTGGTPGATVAGTCRDTRRPAVASASRVTAGTTAAPSTTYYQAVVIPANTTLVLDDPIVLAPRGASAANLLVQMQTVNAALSVGFAFRERRLWPQELSEG